jgi:hypothetical protein
MRKENYMEDTRHTLLKHVSLCSLAFDIICLFRHSPLTLQRVYVCVFVCVCVCVCV